MAELNASSASGRVQGITRSKKLSARVDLTPMVDLGFLLITFFVFTTNISKPTQLEFHMPAGDRNTTIYAESTVLTAIPIDNDRIFYYHGDLPDAEQNGRFGIANYSLTGGLGDIIRKKQQALDANGGKFDRTDLMLIIRPAASASYKNVVDILDEITINQLSHYSLVELTEAEKKFLTSKGF